ncbi:fatty acid desaturase 6-like [Haliotis asinina]|uniref:fatty acid desaturase 6-like n=1 Tax=Haliotis asinina TaxID=109174 RepID=UPI003531A950
MEADDRKMGKISKREVNEHGEVYDYVKLKQLPEFGDLSDKVNALLKRTSWMELYGIDWMIHLTGIAGIAFSLWLLKSDSILTLVVGMLLMGCCHSVLATKGGHLSAHGSVCQSPAWNKFWTVFFVEFVGSFSSEAAIDIHIKYHHPHTNIIGLGDSSTWKMPMLPTYIYMFVAPILLPLATPFVGFSSLFGQWVKLLRAVIVVSLGLALHFYLLMTFSGFSLLGAIVCTFVSRATLAIPYIHVNIFQHIGLPMYSNKDRPKRIYQMATGVLNLNRNPILDYCFGHGIISCHVEHHLFPRLSDNMCLKIKPLVSKFLKESGLPYNEETYSSRLSLFIDKYDELMVNAPPITHFVGLQ